MPQDDFADDLHRNQGLKALRVVVNLGASRPQNQALPEIASKAVEALPKLANIPS